MARFFLDPVAWSDSPALTGEEAVHCSRVMRMRPGDRLDVFDGDGRSAEAVIEAVSRHEVRLRLGPVKHEEAPRMRTVLAQAVIKAKGMEWLIQKAVELGVTEIQPLSTRRAVVKPAEAKADKWRRIALEACKQCGRSRLPVIHEVAAFDGWVPVQEEGLKLMAALMGEARPLAEMAADAVDSTLVKLLIGPEGDFSVEEIQLGVRTGWVPVSLGSAVLRSETAAIYGLSALRFVRNSG